MTDVIDDDWTDLERPLNRGRIRPIVTVCVAGPDSRRKAQASLTMRGEAGEWLWTYGPKYRIQIGGANANKLRIIPDQSGRFCVFRVRTSLGVSRMQFGHLTLWPDEARPAIAPRWHYEDKAMVLILPETWAKPLAKAVEPKPAHPIVAAVRANGRPPLPPSPSAMFVEERARLVIPFGEPAPGRSALDQRKREENGH